MIGGEFEIELNTQCDSFSPVLDTYYYASGRSALYQILKSLRNTAKKVWFPDWLCHTMVEASQKAGFEYCFYELSPSYTATVNALDFHGFKNGDVVILINYFGLQDLSEIAKQVKEAYPQSVIIEDDVQAYYCFTEEKNPYADFRFTSLRKMFAVPDGGLVYTKRPMPIATYSNTFTEYKIKAGVMKRHRGENGIKDEEYLMLYDKGSMLIDDNYESMMSDESKKLFAGTDIQLVKKKRQQNARCILEGLKEKGVNPLIPVSTDKVPLFIPVWIENRDEVRKRMFQNEIYCPVHWPLHDGTLKKGLEMKQHELSLIIDQRYNVSDMEVILQLIY